MSITAPTDPRDVINARIRDSLREGALTAAGILKYTPDLIGDEEIGIFLRRVGHGTVRKDIVSGWLQKAAVNPWRAGSDLSVVQRMRLSAQLLAFAKEQPR
jgi:hypothetical protein